MTDFRLGLYEKSMPDDLSWEERLVCAREAGYDFIEMSIDESDSRLERLNWSDEEVRALLDTAAKSGLRPESVCFSAQRRFPLGSGLPGAGEKALELLYKAILLVSKLGIRIIQTQGYDCYYDEESSFATRERFFRNMRAAAEIASQYGVILGMETMENDFMNTTEKAMYYIREIKSPYLAVYPDIGNLSNAVQDVCKDLRTGRGHIAAAHLKETTPGRFRCVPYGTGRVDFPSIIRALLDQGVRRFTAEFWYQEGTGWREILKSNREFLLAQFEKALAFK
ncbi:MAG TPA: L-ribulose-5-phosphate 4-epimerase [Ruminiclostridium sp.]|nr:L-ribulose-5-phosphate 4-epimerase [Ruminiclostridium sp.]